MGSSVSCLLLMLFASALLAGRFKKIKTHSEPVTSALANFSIYIVGVNMQPTRPLITRQISFTSAASENFVSTVHTPVSINPQVIYITADTFFIIDFEDQLQLSIVSDNMTSVKRITHQIYSQNSTAKSSPAVLAAPIDSSALVLYSDINTSGRLRGLKIYKEGSIIFNDYISNISVSQISTCRLTDSTFAVATSNNNNQTKLYIFDNNFQRVDEFNQELPVTFVSLACNNSKIYLLMNELQLQEFDATNLNAQTITINPNPDPAPASLAVYNSILAIVSASPSIIDLLTMSANSATSNTHIISSTFGNYAATLYPAHSHGYWAVFTKWEADWIEIPFAASDYQNTAFLSRLTLAPAADNLTPLAFRTTNQLVANNAYVVSLKDVDRNTRMSNITLIYFGAFCGNGLKESGEECDGVPFCSATCQCMYGAQANGDCNPSICGDGVVQDGEECDSGNFESGCRNCQCRAGFEPNIPFNTTCRIATVPAPTFDSCSSCQGDTSICLADRNVCVGHRIVPILQCIRDTDDGYKRAFFSYNNQSPNQVIIGLGPNNLVTPSGTPNQAFNAGRSIFFPFFSFRQNYDPNTQVSWFVDGYLLTFNTSDASLECPKNVTFVLRLATASGNVGPRFILLVRQVLSRAMNIDVSRVLGHVVTSSSQKKRQSDLETELQVTVTPSNNQTSGEPSATDAVQQFINNQTAINQVQQQVPEIQEIIGSKSENEVQGQQVVPNNNNEPVTTSTPSTPVAAQVSIGAMPDIATIIYVIGCIVLNV